MRTILLTFFLTISILLSAQDKYIFDTSKIDASIKLVGRYPQYDKQKTYKEFNFIINDPETIKKIIMALPLGKEGENSGEDPDFRINVIQNFKEIKTWTVNPNLNSVMSNGHTYEFDVKKLKGLATKYPFDYKFDKIPFKTKFEYEKYVGEQKNDTTFLFYYAPQFKYEGSFEIQFPRNNEFPNPKAIIDYLAPLLDKIVSKNEYRISYILNKKNLSDQTQYTMTINSSKKLFNELKLDNLKQENWKETVEEGWFFYRTK